MCPQATPRLSEDKVKQCVDPKLKGEYPPKGVAKVSLTSLCFFGSLTLVLLKFLLVWRFVLKSFSLQISP